MEALADIIGRIVASVASRFGERAQTNINAPLVRCMDIGSKGGGETILGTLNVKGEIEESEFSMMPPRQVIIGHGGINNVSKSPRNNPLIINAQNGIKQAGVKLCNPLIGELPLSELSAVMRIFGVTADSDVRSQIVQSVSVDMVDQKAWRCLKYNSVKKESNRSPFYSLIICCVDGVRLHLSLPFNSQRDFCITVINRSDVSASQLDFDGHGDAPIKSSFSEAMGSGARIGAPRVTVSDKTRAPSLVYDRLNGSLIAIDRDGDIGKGDAAAVKREDSLALTVGHRTALLARFLAYLCSRFCQQHELAINAGLRCDNTVYAPQLFPIGLGDRRLPRIGVEAKRDAVRDDRESVADVGETGRDWVCHWPPISATISKSEGSRRLVAAITSAIERCSKNAQDWPGRTSRAPRQYPCAAPPTV